MRMRRTTTEHDLLKIAAGDLETVKDLLAQRRVRGAGRLVKVGWPGQPGLGAGTGTGASEAGVWPHLPVRFRNPGTEVPANRPTLPAIVAPQSASKEDPWQEKGTWRGGSKPTGADSATSSASKSTANPPPDWAQMLARHGGAGSAKGSPLVGRTLFGRRITATPGLDTARHGNPGPSPKLPNRGVRNSGFMGVLPGGVRDAGSGVSDIGYDYVAPRLDAEGRPMDLPPAEYPDIQPADTPSTPPTPPATADTPRGAPTPSAPQPNPVAFNAEGHPADLPQAEPYDWASSPWVQYGLPAAGLGLGAYALYRWLNGRRRRDEDEEEKTAAWPADVGNWFTQNVSTPVSDWAGKNITGPIARSAVQAGYQEHLNNLGKLWNNNPALQYGVYGAGAGAGLGLLGGLWGRKKKVRALGDALTGALMGGSLGGLGGYLWQNSRPKPSPVASTDITRDVEKTPGATLQNTSHFNRPNGTFGQGMAATPTALNESEFLPPAVLDRNHQRDYVAKLRALVGSYNHPGLPFDDPAKLKGLADLNTRLGQLDQLYQNGTPEQINTTRAEIAKMLPGLGLDQALQAKHQELVKMLSDKSTLAINARNALTDLDNIRAGVMGGLAPGVSLSPDTIKALRGELGEQARHDAALTFMTQTLPADDRVDPQLAKQLLAYGVRPDAADWDWSRGVRTKIPDTLDSLKLFGNLQDVRDPWSPAGIPVGYAATPGVARYAMPAAGGLATAYGINRGLVNSTPQMIQRALADPKIVAANEPFFRSIIRAVNPQANLATSQDLIREAQALSSNRPAIVKMMTNNPSGLPGLTAVAPERYQGAFGTALDAETAAQSNVDSGVRAARQAQQTAQQQLDTLLQHQAGLGKNTPAGLKRQIAAAKQQLQQTTKAVATAEQSARAAFTPELQREWLADALARNPSALPAEFAHLQAAERNALIQALRSGQAVDPRALKGVLAEAESVPMRWGATRLLRNQATVRNELQALNAGAKVPGYGNAATVAGGLLGGWALDRLLGRRPRGYYPGPTGLPGVPGFNPYLDRNTPYLQQFIDPRGR